MTRRTEICTPGSAETPSPSVTVSQLIHAGSDAASQWQVCTHSLAVILWFYRTWSTARYDTLSLLQLNQVNGAS